VSSIPTAAEAARRRRAGLELAREERPSASRVELLATFNVDLLPSFLVEAFDRFGLAVDAHAGPFGQLSQEILDPSSGLYAAEPAEVVLVPAVEDLLQPLFTSPPSHFPPDTAFELVHERLAELGGLVETLLERLPAATVYLVVFGTDRLPVSHVLDPAGAERGQTPLEHFTGGVRKLGGLSPRVVVVDWDWHVRAGGWDAVRDDRLWYLGRMRLSPVGCAALAELIARHAAAFRGQAKKVLALDLDGLLWGGVVGETGLSGIEIGEEGVGLAFQDLQRELLKLHDIGVLLVTCSKNNVDDATEVFDRHPGMVLRREHLAAERVNWQDKATNLRELAEELNVGLDSFVFLDDNPVERSWVQQACPEVVVLEVPDDPAERPGMLRDAPWFDRVETTAADRGRATSYREQRERRRLQQNTTSFEDFLASLEQEAVIERVNDGSLARAAQLCQRTNQFNLTTKRYTSSDLERMIVDPDYDLFTLSVRDRFGESGITGLAILHHEDERTAVDTLLMSCRILGRRLEDAFLAYLAERAAAQGSSSLVGLFEPTAKNAQVAAFYSERGFERDADGVFSLDLRRGGLETPAGIVVKVGSNA
jgi:FkbH-like protein